MTYDDDLFYAMILAGLEVDDEAGDDESSGEWGKASLSLIVIVAIAFAALFWWLV